MPLNKGTKAAGGGSATSPVMLKQNVMLARHQRAEAVRFVRSVRADAQR